MIITRESVMDFSESIEQFGNIFKEAGINEAEVTAITEASVKEIFSRIKEFFKKIFDKFMDMIHSKFATLNSGEKYFNEIYHKNSNKINSICKKIKSQEIPDERLEGHEFYLYENFSVDHLFRGTVLVHNHIGEFDKKYILDYVTGKSHDTNGKEDGWSYDPNEFIKHMQWEANTIIRRAVEGIVKSLLHDYKAFDDLDGYTSFEDAKPKIIEICEGEKKLITGRNISRINSNMSDICKNKDLSANINKVKSAAKLAHDNAIKDLNDIEKEILKRSDTIKDNITKAINSYTSIVKTMYELQLKALDLGIEIRAKQISEYMKILKFLLTIGKGKEIKESSIFESVEFI